MIGSVCLAALIAGATAVGSSHGTKTISPMFGGRLVVEGAKTTFSPQVASQNWWIRGGFEGVRPENDGTFRFKLQSDDQQPRIDATLQTAAVADGVRVRYAFTPTADANLNLLALAARFEYGDYAGGWVEIDGKRVDLPTDRMTRMFASGKFRTVALRTPGGEPSFTIDFECPCHVSFQSNRPWGKESFSLRIVPEKNTEMWCGGVTYAVDFTLRGAGEYDSHGLVPFRVADSEGWTPFSSAPWVAAGSALDFTNVRCTEKPAGKYGRVVARGAHFEFEGLPGVRQRFYGVNLCESGNVPPVESVYRFAENLARAGYNALRIHHYENFLVDKSDPARMRLNKSAMERFDALVAACVEHGIYLTTDVYVSRKGVQWRSVGIDRDGTVPMGDYKHLVMIHPGVYSNWCGFARAFLGHRNGLTGRVLADEPALIGLSLVNEAPLDQHLMDKFRHSKIWCQAWKEFLQRRRQAMPEMWNGVADSIPADYEPTRHVAGFLCFEQEMEAQFAKRATAFLREELKCRAPLTNMNCGGVDAFQVVRHDAYDYTDTHFYVDHPEFMGKAWSVPSWSKNANPIRDGRLGAPSVSTLRFFDRPFTITEYNYCGPGRFRGLGGMLAGALASLQDWSGLWRFAWSHGDDGVVHPETKGVGYFDIANDPVQRASDLASICLFLRGDLESLSEERPVVLDRASLDRPALTHCRKSSRRNLARYAWQVKLGTSFGEAEEPNTDGLPGNGRVSFDESNGGMCLTTELTCGGFSEKGVIDADILKADVSGAPAAVWASSLDGRALGRSRRILLVHLTDVQNSDTEYCDKDLQIVFNFGNSKDMVMKNGRAGISLKVENAQACRVWALNADGTRRCTLPATVENGSLRFVADVARDPASATYLYEVSCCEDEKKRWWQWWN